MSRPGPSPWLYWGLVAVFCLSWASGFTVAKLAIATAPPAIFGGIRFLCAGALLMGWAVWRREIRPGTPWGILVLLGLLNQAGYQGLAWQGMGTVSAGLVTIIASLNPILIAAAAVPLLGERMHWRKVAGLLLGFAGAVFVVRHRVEGVGEDPHGILLVVGALLSLAAGTLAFKRLAPNATLAVAVGTQCLAAGTTLLVLGLLFEPASAVNYTLPTFWLTLAWSVGVMSIGSLLVWFWLLRVGTASSASALHFTVPPVGLAMSWAILGERASWDDLVGVVPVALGIWLVTRPAPLAVSAPAR